LIQQHYLIYYSELPYDQSDYDKPVHLKVFNDLDKMNEATTSDFMLYEDGKIWNNDSLSALLSTFPKYTAIFKFDNFNIDVDSKSGSMYYSNLGNLTINDTTEVASEWIESASFQKVDGIWKINFFTLNCLRNKMLSTTKNKRH